MEEPKTKASKPAEAAPAKAVAKTEPAEPVKAAPVKEKKAKKSKKGLIIGILIVILLAGGGVGAFFLIKALNRSPETIFVESLAKTFDESSNISTRGSIKVGSMVDIQLIQDKAGKNAKTNIKIKADLSAFTGLNTMSSAGYSSLSYLPSTSNGRLDLDVDYILANDKSYVRVNNLGTTLRGLNLMSASDLALYSDFIDQIGGAWFEVDTSSLNVYAKDDASQCVLNSLTSGDIVKTVSDLVRDHNYFTFKEYSKSGDTTTYAVSVNVDKLDEFVNAALSNAKVKEIAGCSNASLPEKFDIKSIPGINEMFAAELPVYADIKGGNLTRFNFEQPEAGLSMNFEFDYSGKATVEAPSESTNLNELINLFGGGNTGGNDCVKGLDTKCGDEDDDDDDDDDDDWSWLYDEDDDDDDYDTDLDDLDIDIDMSELEDAMDELEKALEALKGYGL